MSENQANTASGIDKIVDALKNKASLKQEIYRTTLESFGILKNHVNEIANQLDGKFSQIDSSVQIECTEKGSFETQMKFSGDTLIFSMHTNVFNFEEGNKIHNSEYVKEDPSRAYCGMIAIYNFLSDSFKYQRMNDSGYLIARIFINKDRHFFVEGKRQLGFLYEDFGGLVLTEDFIKMIVEAAILYSLDFDLWAPAYNEVQEMTVGEKLVQTGTLMHKTAKRLGFQFSAEQQNSEA